jgi:hypothetical protein
MPSVPPIPWYLRLLDRAGALAGGRWPALRPERFWADAAAAAGDDRPWPEAQEALGVLLDQAQSVHLSTLGRLAFTWELPVQLEQLLQVRRAVPDPEKPVLPPVFIVALPRTGTTLLHRLLSLHQGARWPRMWELMRPWPPPRDLEHDGRIALAEAKVRDARRIMRGFDQVHALDARGPEECYFLLEQTSCSAAYDSRLPIPGYMRWFYEQDLRWTYLHHRRSLLSMQEHLPGAFWLLKAPLHLFGLEALRQVYPDARLIVTHREPREVAPSCCSLYAYTRSIYVDPFVPTSLGKPWLEAWGTATDRAERALATWPAERVAHVDYREMLRDPVGVTGRLVEGLALPADPGFAERVRRWSEDPAHRQGRGGAHRYTLEEYGLRAEEVDERFASWRAMGERARR